MRKLPPLNALKAFESCSRHLSFTLAAHELLVTQSAVSRQVRHLEDWLGVTLLNRGPGKLGLTGHGQKLAPVLKEVLDRIEYAANEVSHSGVELRIKAPPTFAVRWLMPRLYEFQQLAPDVGICLEAALGHVDFRRESFDAAVIRCSGPGSPGHFDDHTEIGDSVWERLTPIVAPALLERTNAIDRPEDLLRFTFLHSSHEYDYWAAWLRRCGIVARPLREMHFELMDTAIQAAVLGFGVALANPHFVVKEVAHGALLFPFRDIAPKMSAYRFLCSNSTAKHPGVSRFQQWCADRLRQEWSESTRAPQSVSGASAISETAGSELPPYGCAGGVGVATG